MYLYLTVARIECYERDKCIHFKIRFDHQKPACQKDNNLPKTNLFFQSKSHIDSVYVIAI